jgi:AraC-like DNA-binding protein
MRTSDLEFFRYFPISDRDRQWGIYVSGVGSTHVPPGARSYPVSVHPDAYMYAWENGRVLDEYQSLYIARGDGRFESHQSGPLPVAGGSVMLLFPGEWHRYRPSRASGWDEYWVSFGGQYMDYLVREGFFSPAQPVLATGVDEAIQHAYVDLLDRARAEPIGHQQLNAASVQEILAAALAAVRRQRHGGRGEEVVRRAKAALEQRVEGTISVARLAASLALSEEHLRRLFREHTGMSPYQYYLELKIHRARQMLRETTLSVKQIAHTLGFESQFHFSKTFKHRTGTAPARWRRGD